MFHFTYEYEVPASRLRLRTVKRYAHGHLQRLTPAIPWFAGVMALFLALTLLNHARAFGATRPVVLDSRHHSYDLSGHLEYCDDPTGRLTLADMVSPVYGTRFKPLPGYLNRGFTSKAVWIRFAIEKNRALTDDYWLRLYPPNINQVTVYVQSGMDPANPSSYKEMRLGNRIPVGFEPALNPDFVALMSVARGQTMMVYCRLQSKSTPISMAGMIHTRKDLSTQTYRNGVFQGISFGFLLLVALIAFIIFLRIREPLFLYLCIYALAVAARNLSVGEILDLIAPAHAYTLHDYLDTIGMGAALIMVAKILSEIFSSSASPWLQRYLGIVSVIGALTMASTPLGIAGQMGYILSVASVLLFIFINLQVFSRIMAGPASSPETLLTIAFAISGIGYFLYFMQQLGWLPLSWWSYNLVNMSSLLNIVLFVFALAERFRQAEKQSREASKTAEQKAMALASAMTLDLRKNEANLQFALDIERMAGEQKNRFVSMISHEYRNPLAIIQTNLEIMLLELAGKAPKAEIRIHKMLKASNRLVELMEGALERTRLTEGRDREGFIPIDFSAFVDEEVRYFRSVCSSCRILYSAFAEKFEVYGDPRILKTVIFNLLDNAQKYSPPRTPIRIDCSQKGLMAIIRINNQADGFDPGEAPELFQKYRRGKNSGDIRGSGIGLWMVREIVSMHEGTVTMENTSDGIMVTMTLPIMMPEGAMILQEET